MRTAAGWLYVLAALEGIAAVAVGALLMLHTVQECSDFGVCTSGHPFTLGGLAVLVGGGINAVVLAVVGRLCDAVADLRVVAVGGGDAAPVDAEPGYVPGEPPGMYGRKG